MVTNFGHLTFLPLTLMVISIALLCNILIFSQTQMTNVPTTRTWVVIAYKKGKNISFFFYHSSSKQRWYYTEQHTGMSFKQGLISSTFGLTFLVPTHTLCISPPFCANDACKQVEGNHQPTNICIYVERTYVICKIERF